MVSRTRDYNVEAETSMEAARTPLAIHGQTVADDAVITVIIDGRGLMLSGYAAHNALLRPMF